MTQAAERAHDAMAGAANAIARAQAAWTDPRQDALTWKRRTGGQIVGCIGAGIPSELIAAAGMLPVRLRGRPGASTAAVDSIVEKGADPWAMSIAAQILDGSLDYVDHIVFSSMPAIVPSLYGFMMHLGAHEGSSKRPSFYLYDFHRSGHAMLADHNRACLNAFRTRLGSWAGSAVRDADLERMITYNDARRALIERVGALRAGRDGRLSGTDAVALLAAQYWMPCDDHVSMLSAVIDDVASLPPSAAMPVVYSGSDVDDLAVYRALEAGGVRIVGDDQNWGTRGSESVSIPDPDPIESLRLGYQARPPETAGSSTRERADYLTRLCQQAGVSAVLFHILAIDHAAAWDYPRLRDTLRAGDILSVEMGPQPYAGADLSALTDQVARVVSKVAEGDI